MVCFITFQFWHHNCSLLYFVWLWACLKRYFYSLYAYYTLFWSHLGHKTSFFGKNFSVKSTYFGGQKIFFTIIHESLFTGIFPAFLRPSIQCFFHVKQAHLSGNTVRTLYLWIFSPLDWLFFYQGGCAYFAAKGALASRNIFFRSNIKKQVRWECSPTNLLFSVLYL